MSVIEDNTKALSTITVALLRFAELGRNRENIKRSF